MSSHPRVSVTFYRGLLEYQEIRKVGTVPPTLQLFPRLPAGPALEGEQSGSVCIFEGVRWENF